MNPYYFDKWVTIYNSPTDRFECDVVVLDPPKPLTNANVFKANIYYIFCGSLYDFYRDQFPTQRKNNVAYRVSIPDGINRVIHTDLVLAVGNVLVPGLATYNLKPTGERYHKWERPLEFVLNLLGSSKGDILDPFMGSGTVLVAAKLLGRKAVGFDIDEQCCEIATERCRRIQ